MSGSFSGETEVNGVRLHYRLDGPEQAPTVALVNSLGTDLTMWEPQIAALTRHYRVLRHDTRGHGRSAVPHGPYTMDKLVDDLLGLLQHTGAERFHVVGISLGGMEAVATALRKPRGLASVAVCDSRLDAPPGAAQAIDDRVRLVREQGMAPLAEAMIQRWFTPATLTAKPPYLDDVRRMLLATPVEGFAGCAAAIKHASLREPMKEIRLPSLFIVGAQDVALPVAIAREMQNDIPNARLAEIADAGHLSNLERPEAFNAALLGFLGAVK